MQLEALEIVDAGDIWRLGGRQDASGQDQVLTAKVWPALTSIHNRCELGACLRERTRFPAKAVCGSLNKLLGGHTEDAAPSARPGSLAVASSVQRRAALNDHQPLSQRLPPAP